MMNFMTEQYVRITTRLAHLLKKQEGQTLVEYALLLVLIAIVVIGAVKLIGTNANTTYSKVGSALQ